MHGMPALYFVLVVSTIVVSFLLTFVHEECMDVFYRILDWLTVLLDRRTTSL